MTEKLGDLLDRWDFARRMDLELAERGVPRTDPTRRNLAAKMQMYDAAILRLIDLELGEADAVPVTALPRGIGPQQRALGQMIN